MGNRSFLAAGAALVLTCGLASAQDTNQTTIEMSAVPQTVKDAAMKAAGDVQLTEGNTEVEAGKTIYELRGKMTDGMTMEVDVMEDGTIEEIEKEINQTAVPQPVMDALMAKMPSYKPSKIESSEKDGTIVQYEFEGDADGQKMDATVKADASDVTSAQMAN